MNAEAPVRIESIRIPHIRKRTGPVVDLAESIRDEGAHKPVTLWKDGTIISGSRRLRAHMLLEREAVPALFVDTIEDAAKRLLDDNQDDYLAAPMTWSDICRLWELLRRLDAPAAAWRANENRRRGVELRRKTQEGKRKPGRSDPRSEDYVLTVLCQPFGVSSATARRAELVYQTATGVIDAPDDKRELARKILDEMDTGASVWNGYQRLMDLKRTPRSRPTATKAEVPTDSVPAAKQLTAWARSLPQLTGLTAGLVELGPPNKELTWEQVGPVHAQLSAVRRDLEKVIKQMKGLSQS